MKNKGFTLIELIVFIAIVGLLTAVVLASLHDAKLRTSGKEEDEREYCLSKGKYRSITDLPASCIKYFQEEIKLRQ